LGKWGLLVVATGEDVLAELERRQQIQTVDLWEAAAFHCRELAKDVTG